MGELLCILCQYDDIDDVIALPLASDRPLTLAETFIAEDFINRPFHFSAQSFPCVVSYDGCAYSGF